ncbi:MAG: hypothetical protein IT440_03000 [Phycisphaeraceae bacterium]|nr:hypothetical protein [Phycisphaeraceae bacterium]
MSTTTTFRTVRRDDLLVEVEVELLDQDHPWGPFLSSRDAMKLNRVRRALREGDLREAAKWGRLYRLTPVKQA